MKKNKIIIGIIIAILLAFAFWYGGDSPSLRGWNTRVNETVEMNQREEVIQTIIDNEDNLVQDIEEHEVIDTLTEKESDENLANMISEETANTIESKETAILPNELTCTISIRCDAILDNIEWLDKEKVGIVPSDGVILAEKTVVFSEGDTVFDVLLRETKNNKIHMEFVNVPIYNSAYIEAIANLYEFDCGELSGWMYKVNGEFPNYGCSQYQIKSGDKVEWIYTCDLGSDIGR